MPPHTATHWHLVLRHIDTSYCNTLTPRTATETTSCYDTMTPHTMYDTITHETIHLIFMSVLFWELLAFVNWFYVSLKVSFPCCFIFTKWAWELLASMDRFYVCRKVWLPCCFVFTMWAWVLFAFMDWFNVSLKTSSWVALHSQCEHGNFWPSWTDFMCALRCLFCDDL